MGFLTDLFGCGEDEETRYWREVEREELREWRRDRDRATQERLDAIHQRKRDRRERRAEESRAAMRRWQESERHRQERHRQDRWEWERNKPENREDRIRYWVGL